MPTAPAMSPRDAPAAASSLARQIWRSWRASMNWIRSGGSRLRSMFVHSASARGTSPRPIALVSSKMRVLARLGDQVFDVVDADRALAADVDAPAARAPARAARGRARQRRQRAGGVGLDVDAAGARLAAQPAGERVVPQRREHVQEAALAQRRERAQPDVDLVADQQQAGRRGWDPRRRRPAARGRRP